jgi:hypothetical protein
MDDENPITKIKDLNKGKFTIIAKVTRAETGSADKKFLQRGLLSDDTGSVDFVIYRDAQLEILDIEKVYRFTNVYASDNKGLLTLRPNKRMDQCTITQVDEDLLTNSSRIFREKARIPSVLKEETCQACSQIFSYIIENKFSASMSFDERVEWLAIFHDTLIEQYKNNEIISYDDDAIQDGYMYGYFPFYIGMIYHILRGTEIEHPENIFLSELNVCLYGCGPAPELLGLAAYIRDFQPQVRTINVTFLDQNSWDKYREYCVTQLLPLFWRGGFHSQFCKFDLLTFPEGIDQKMQDAISLATIHNFQNILSDLYKTPENLKKMGTPLFDLYQRTQSGNLTILSDQYYGETARIFEKIAFIAQKYKFGTVLGNPSTIHNYHREFDTPDPMANIGHHYKNEMGFHAMILKRT